ncbi:MAG: phosphoribosyltransferase family protein [Planctomycetota bacterium]|nr:phosphoribosyltransferase family protein [Planctomycetota bacterium]
MTATAKNPSAHAAHKVGRVVVPRDRIADRVGELGRQITEDYRGREMTILAVMNGAAVFLADLIRRLPLAMRLETTTARSYRGRATAPGGLTLADLQADAFAGRHILVVDDILDTGQTLQTLLGRLSAFSPASTAVCVLLRKARPTLPPPVDVRYVGFDIADEFIVGYGLDHDDLHRNLPDLCVLHGDAEGLP